MCLLSLKATLSFAANDAAVEAKEGDIEHWIEYYKKERGSSNETVTAEPGGPDNQPADTIDAAPVNDQKQKPATQSGNR